MGNIGRKKKQERGWDWRGPFISGAVGAQWAALNRLGNFLGVLAVCEGPSPRDGETVVSCVLQAAESLLNPPVVEAEARTGC